MRGTFLSSLCLALGVVCAASALPATVDGTWVAKVEGRKGIREIVFHLKTDGERLTGTVDAGKKGQSMEIQEGKVNGDQISFTTTARGKKQPQPVKLLWSGTIEGKELKVTRQREGGPGGEPLTAVRQ